MKKLIIVFVALVGLTSYGSKIARDYVLGQMKVNNDAIEASCVVDHLGGREFVYSFKVADVSDLDREMCPGLNL